ncbi:putative N-acetyltransferase YhbS [Paenibacillus shirakamiensis]|uniref:N-acetyltransferase YhbS n=1 Tax=Paenibacillus shirakamiensis TaxID=1265935 RepID=A0ABS4JD18_9BACL|nr:GNAT family N-acetyltransferase [Paenibacillus shirakamiensis]MBP1999614.1 putative N-acetyltransferase YhbS [Paenibacillus shirakamiensis]
MSNQVYAPALLIRKCSGNDAKAITVLMRQLRYPTTVSVMKERLTSLENHPHYRSFVAELDGKVVGTISLRQFQTNDMERPVTRITSLIVDEDHRGKGIGKLLMAEVEAWGKRKGSEELFLSTGDDHRLEAKPFYEHLGFQCSGYRLSKSLI